MKKRVIILLFLIMCLTACMSNFTSTTSVITREDSAQQTITVYSSRHYEIDSKLFKAFEEQTGIVVKEIKGTPEEMITRMKQEGKNSPADLFISVDAGVMTVAKDSEVLQPLSTDTILENVPAEWRDSEGYWTGLSSRARVIVYAIDRVKPNELSTYEDLADEKWKGKLLVRSSSSLYNQSLLASLLYLDGAMDAERWANSVVENMARSPIGGDIDQAIAIMDGVGDIAIMNTYYVGQLMASNDSILAEKAQNLGIFFPNQHTTGTHVNISGIGLAKYAPNKENALKLIEFLTSEEIQSQLSQSSYEYPVNPNAQLPPLLESWGSFKRQSIPYDEFLELREEAIHIFESVGWDSTK